MFMKHYAPNRCEPSIEALDCGRGGGGQGRCERRSEVYMKFKKKTFFFLFIFFFFGGGGGSGPGGQGTCERRSEVL